MGPPKVRAPPHFIKLSAAPRGHRRHTNGDNRATALLPLRSLKPHVQTVALLLENDISNQGPTRSLVGRNSAYLPTAHSSDRGLLFQPDRRRHFNAIVDARGVRASDKVNDSHPSAGLRKWGLALNRAPIEPHTVAVHAPSVHRAVAMAALLRGG